MFNRARPNRQFLRPNPNNDAVYSLSPNSDTHVMKPESATLAAISVGAPTFSQEAVSRAIEAQFGLIGEYSPLVSERDQNFMLRADDGGHFVAKVTSGLEEAAATDFQVEALLHLEVKGGLYVPRAVRTKAGETFGEISGDNGSYRLRVVTWVDGEPLESQGLNERSVCNFGAALARLDKAFAGYTHPGENPALLWDLQRVLELRELIDYISDSSARKSVTQAADDFENRVLPVLGDLRYQVIHSDANPGNILLADDRIGFIDFGDIVKAPLVFDVAIAMSYLRSFDANPLKFMVPFVAAYHAVNPLEAREADVLFDLVRARLTTTITLLYWRLSARAENDAYRQKALEVESGAGRFLAILDSIGRSEFREKLAFIQ